MPKTERQVASRRPDLARVLAGMLGVLALLTQLLAPSFSYAGQGDWIEICSELGPVMIQVDPETGAPADRDCPECDDCAFCAVSPSVASTSGVAVVTDDMPCAMASTGQSILPLANPAQYWSLLRGPPLAPHDMAQRALRAVPATTLMIGGVPWT